MAKTTRAAINTEENEMLVSWSRQATVDEKKPVFVADIFKRIIHLYQRDYGDAVPKPIETDSECERNEG